MPKTHTMTLKRAKKNAPHPDSLKLVPLKKTNNVKSGLLKNVSGYTLGLKTTEGLEAAAALDGDYDGKCPAKPVPFNVVKREELDTDDKVGLLQIELDVANAKCDYIIEQKKGWIHEALSTSKVNDYLKEERLKLKKLLAEKADECIQLRAKLKEAEELLTQSTGEVAHLRGEAGKSDRRLCILCQENSPCWVFTSCGHLVSCNKCHITVANHEATAEKCPICKEEPDYYICGMAYMRIWV